MSLREPLSFKQPHLDSIARLWDMRCVRSYLDSLMGWFWRRRVGIEGKAGAFGLISSVGSAVFRIQEEELVCEGKSALHAAYGVC